MARLLMCRYNRSPLLTWQAPYSGRGYPGHLALLQGAGSSPLAGAHANHHDPRGRAKRRKQKGARVEPARDFAQRQLQCVDQIQWRYELSRPLVLCAEGTPTQRAEDTHTPPDTVRTFLRRFRQEGMRGLLPTAIAVAPRPRASRVPEAVQQDMARRKALDNDLQYREIVRIIFYTCGYRLHPTTAKRLWQQSQPAIQEALALGAYHSQGDRYQAQYQSGLPRLPPDHRSVDAPLCSGALRGAGGQELRPQGSRPESLVATQAGGLAPPKAPSGCGGVAHLESARPLGDCRAHRGAPHGPQPAGL
jgi:hypothetical protein